jgi:hypothetical protein
VECHTRPSATASSKPYKQTSIFTELLNFYGKVTYNWSNVTHKIVIRLVGQGENALPYDRDKEEKDSLAP